MCSVLICDLINEDRHADHGDPVVHRLQHPVHAAVRDEEEGAGVGQHRLLRHLQHGVCTTGEHSLHYTYQLTQLTTMTLSGAARVQCSLSSFMMTRCGSRENTDIRPAIVACGTA